MKLLITPKEMTTKEDSLYIVKKFGDVAERVKKLDLMEWRFMMYMVFIKSVYVSTLQQKC